MYNYLITVNIVMSYALWVTVTLALYGKIKNKFIYVLFPIVLYAVPSLFFIYVSPRRILHVILLVFALVSIVFFRFTKYSRIIAVFIPLPLIMDIVYELLVSAN
jgi:hypothetical protein